MKYAVVNFVVAMICIYIICGMKYTIGNPIVAGKSILYSQYEICSCGSLSGSAIVTGVRSSKIAV